MCFRYWLLYTTVLWPRKTFWNENPGQSSAGNCAFDSSSALSVLLISLLSSRDWSAITTWDSPWLLCSRVRKLIAYSQREGILIENYHGTKTSVITTANQPIMKISKMQEVWENSCELVTIGFFLIWWVKRLEKSFGPILEEIELNQNNPILLLTLCWK